MKIRFEMEAAKRCIEQDSTLLSVFERTATGLPEAVRLEMIFENYIRGDRVKELTYYQLTKQSGGLTNGTSHHHP